MQGILLIDKPAGWTSFDVVNYTRKIVAQHEGKKPKNCKVGHTGTLDPFATGLLVLLIGKDYTRRASEFSKSEKTYEVTMRLGQKSSTGDPEGIITDVESGIPDLDQLQETLKSFTGIIMQTPPAYSAIKIDGQRAYKLAREGKEVIIEPREAIIHSLSLLSYEFPVINFVASVSAGTYIRTLVEDMAVAMGTAAYTTDLRRTAAGRFSINASVTPADLDSDLLARVLIEA